MKSGGFWKEQEEASILVKNNEEAQRRKEMKKKRKNNVKIAYPPGRGLLMMSQISRAETDGHFFFFFENLKKNLKRPIRLLHSSKRRLFFTAEKSSDRLKFWISTKKWRCIFFLGRKLETRNGLVDTVTGDGLGKTSRSISEEERCTRWKQIESGRRIGDVFFRHVRISRRWRSVDETISRSARSVLVILMGLFFSLVVDLILDRMTGRNGSDVYLCTPQDPE